MTGFERRVLRLRKQLQECERNGQAKQRNTEGQTAQEEQTEELRQKAKELGIKSYHNMKHETLVQKIAELEGD